MWQVIDYVLPPKSLPNGYPVNSPYPRLYDGKVIVANSMAEAIQSKLNKDKPTAACCEVLEVYICVHNGFTPTPVGPPNVLIRRTETPDEARFRWQHQFVPRSFHGAIFGGQANHRNVTAYDVAIGGGKASSDPEFYRYLCKVADWRLQRNAVPDPPRVYLWKKFLEGYSEYFSCEPAWRSYLIEANSKYYSSGLLPDKLPVLPEGLPNSVISELT